MNFFLIIAFILLLSGCKFASDVLHKATAPRIHNYDTVNNSLQSCSFDETINTIKNNNENELLKNAEIGLTYYFKESYTSSNNYLDRAINQYRINENKASFALSNILREEYQGEGYDKVFLHNYKAINYLMMGNSEKARVEAKNSNLYQMEARSKLSEFKANSGTSNQSFSRFDKIFNSVNPQHTPYQNPFAYYISALGYEEDNEYDQALVDIHNAIKYAPYSNVLKEKLVQYQNGKKTQSVELFFDVGKSPTKSQVKIPLDMGNGETRMAYLPAFSQVYKSDVDSIRVIDSMGNEITRSSLLSDVKAIKINEFREKLPSIAYILTKEVGVILASKTLDEKSKGIATIFKIANAVYNQQDVSTWGLLPEKILVASFIPKSNESYTMELISHSGMVLQTSRLRLDKKDGVKNIYKHFIVRNHKMCSQ